MLIDVLVCASDGTQTLETRNVPEDYFPLPAQPPTELEQLRADVDYLSAMTGVSL